MTITLSKEELTKFQAELSEWFDNRSMFIVQGISDGGLREPYGYSAPSRDRVSKLSEEFTAKNPKPDWRSLL